jgi:hypothetical protein
MINKNMAVSIEFRVNKYLFNQTKNYFRIKENECFEIPQDICFIKGEQVFGFYQPNDSVRKEKILISNYAIHFDNGITWLVLPYKEIRKIGFKHKTEKIRKEHLCITLEDGRIIDLPVKGKSKFQKDGKEIEYLDIFAFFDFLNGVIRSRCYLELKEKP